MDPPPPPPVKLNPREHFIYTTVRDTPQGTCKWCKWTHRANISREAKHLRTNCPAFAARNPRYFSGTLPVVGAPRKRPSNTGNQNRNTLARYMGQLSSTRASSVSPVTEFISQRQSYTESSIPPQISSPTMPATKVWSRRPEAEERARQPPALAAPIAAPPSDLEALRQDGDSFTLDQFTFEDAWVLGSLLRRRLAAIPGAAAVVSITLANSSQVLFQAVTGPGVMPDNEVWVQRKRNTALRWGTSTWFQHCKYGGDEAAFRATFGMGDEAASRYTIHGGAVPIRVRGVEGVVAVVVVSGLKQHEDHGVIVEVIKENWQ